MSDQPLLLTPHPAHLIEDVTRLEFTVARDGAGLFLQYDLIGDLSRLHLPSGEGGLRRDALWRRTCFELFIEAEATDGYLEFNFAPNGDWAAYQFSGFREGQSDLAIAAPRVDLQMAPGHFSFTVRLGALPTAYRTQQLRLGPTAIIETNQSELSYWALQHPSNKPDFHRSETFQLNLD